jgi:hypothetical protein
MVSNEGIRYDNNITLLKQILGIYKLGDLSIITERFETIMALLFDFSMDDMLVFGF